MGSGDDPRLLPHRALVEADRLLGRDARSGRRARGGIPRSLPQPVRAAAWEWERFEAALEDDFNTPDALAVMHGWRDHELLRRALDIFGLASLAEQEDAPPEVVELAKQRQEARGARDFDEADRLRAEIEAAGWEARDVADGFQLVPR